MEFKDKLKKLRVEKGLSQQALADAIFVSRSAVAKWENGLGVPRGETFEALLEYFGVTKEEFITEEPEEVIVEKNKSIHRLTLLLRGCGTFLLVVVSILLPIMMMSGKYGLFPEMAAGSFSDNPFIQTKDYRIYYGSADLILQEGGTERKIEHIDFFRPVKRTWFGWYVYEEDYQYRQIFSEGKEIGIIYSLKGRNGYYHIIRMSYDQVTTDFFEFDSLSVDGEEYSVQLNSFLETENPLKYFEINGTPMYVGSTLMWWSPIK